MTPTKKKIAFIKFGGMAYGGTEKVLQTIASHLPKSIYTVDFYYCDAAPYIGSNFKHPNTDLSRINYCLDNGVNLIKFRVGKKDTTTSTHDWVDTNFWDCFNELDYDLIVTGRAGHPEYPFNLINKTTMIDTIHLSGMAENKPNVYKSVLISSEQKDNWVSAGGPSKRAVLIPNPVEIPKTKKTIQNKNKFVFGMHQRVDDNIFSPIPLKAYKKIETENTKFMILGGSDKYKVQAKSLNIKNIKFYPATPLSEEIHTFLNSLTVYAHGRSDGEQCSTAIIEGMSHGLPVISHAAPSMGQVEQIGNGGYVANNVESYADVMNKLIENNKYYKYCSEESLKRYRNHYSLDSIMNKYLQLFEEAIQSRNRMKINIIIFKILSIYRLPINSLKKIIKSLISFLLK
jgi:glycosyltransferase involved in cell wall biosynthesis